MRLDYLHLKRKPAQSALPTARDEHRGDLRVLSGDGSTTTDGLYFGRNRAGTLEFTELVAADFPTLGKQLDTTGTAPTIAALTAAGDTAAVTGVAGNGICGVFTLTPGGAGIAAGSVVRFTFAAARPDALYTVILTPMSSAARALGGVVGPTSRSTTTVEIDTRTALTSGSTYSWGFFIAGY
jgi:hypothetical protein